MLCRTSVTEDFAHGWPAGLPQPPWGLWCLHRARTLCQLYLVFSEPDAWVLWLHALPALALQDPVRLEADHVDGRYLSLLIHRMPSPRGQNLVERTQARLKQLCFPGRVADFRLCDGHTHLSDLYRAAPADFAKQLENAVHQARPLAVPAGPPPMISGAAYEAGWPSRLYLPPASVHGPLSPTEQPTDAPPRSPPEEASFRDWLDENKEDLLFCLGRECGDAMRFLQIELSGGPRPAQELLRAARQHGLSPRTLRRAKKLLRIASLRRYGADGVGLWEWTLLEKSAGVEEAYSIPPAKPA
jgi:hypothetical protein